MEVFKDLGEKSSDTEVWTIPWLECVWEKPEGEEAGTMNIVKVCFVRNTTKQGKTKQKTQ